MPPPPPPPPPLPPPAAPFFLSFPVSRRFRRVAQNLLDMSEVGVLLVGEMHPSKPGRAKDRLALIGRVCARIESVDFNALFKR